MDRELNSVKAKVLSQDNLAFAQKMNDERIRSFIDKAGYVTNLPANVTPREFLHRIFPSCTSSVLELVWLGTGGCMEQTIGQLASMSKPSYVPELNPMHMLHPSFQDTIHRSHLYLPQFLQLNVGVMEKMDRRIRVQNSTDSSTALRAFYDREKELGLVCQRFGRGNHSAKENSPLNDEYNKTIRSDVKEQDEDGNDEPEQSSRVTGMVRLHADSDNKTKVPLKFSVAALLGEMA